MAAAGGGDAASLAGITAEGGGCSGGVVVRVLGLYRSAATPAFFQNARLDMSSASGVNCVYDALVSDGTHRAVVTLHPDLVGLVESQIIVEGCRVVLNRVVAFKDLAAKVARTGVLVYSVRLLERREVGPALSATMGAAGAAAGAIIGEGEKEAGAGAGAAAGGEGGGDTAASPVDPLEATLAAEVAAVAAEKRLPLSPNTLEVKFPVFSGRASYLHRLCDDAVDDVDVWVKASNVDGVSCREAQLVFVDPIQRLAKRRAAQKRREERGGEEEEEDEEPVLPSAVAQVAAFKKQGDVDSPVVLEVALNKNGEPWTLWEALRRESPDVKRKRKRARAKDDGDVLQHWEISRTDGQDASRGMDAEVAVKRLTHGAGGGYGDEEDDTALADYPRPILVGRLLALSRIGYFGSKPSSAVAAQPLPFKFTFRIQDSSRYVDIIAWNGAVRKWHSKLSHAGIGSLIAVTGFRVKLFENRFEVSVNASGPEACLFRVREDTITLGDTPYRTTAFPPPQIALTSDTMSLYHHPEGAAVSFAGIITRVGPLCTTPIFDADIADGRYRIGGTYGVGDEDGGDGGDRVAEKGEVAGTAGMSAVKAARGGSRKGQGAHRPTTTAQGGQGAAAAAAAGGDGGNAAAAMPTPPPTAVAAFFRSGTFRDQAGAAPGCGIWYAYRWVWLRSPTALRDVAVKLYTNSLARSVLLNDAVLKPGECLIVTCARVVATPRIIIPATGGDDVGDGGGGGIDDRVDDDEDYISLNRPLYLLSTEWSLSVHSSSVQEALLCASDCCVAREFSSWINEVKVSGEWETAFPPSKLGKALRLTSVPFNTSLFRPNKLDTYRRIMCGFHGLLGGDDVVTEAEGDGGDAADVSEETHFLESSSRTALVPMGSVRDLVTLRDANVSFAHAIVTANARRPLGVCAPDMYPGLPQQNGGPVDEPFSVSALTQKALSLQPHQLLRVVIVARVTALHVLASEDGDAAEKASIKAEEGGAGAGAGGQRVSQRRASSRLQHSAIAAKATSASRRGARSASAAPTLAERATIAAAAAAKLTARELRAQQRSGAPLPSAPQQEEQQATKPRRSVSVGAPAADGASRAGAVKAKRPPLPQSTRLSSRVILRALGEDITTCAPGDDDGVVTLPAEEALAIYREEVTAYRAARDAQRRVVEGGGDPGSLLPDAPPSLDVVEDGAPPLILPLKTAPRPLFALTITEPAAPGAAALGAGAGAGSSGGGTIPSSALLLLHPSAFLPYAIRLQPECQDVADAESTVETLRSVFPPSCPFTNVDAVHAYALNRTFAFCVTIQNRDAPPPAGHAASLRVLPRPVKGPPTRGGEPTYLRSDTEARHAVVRVEAIYDV